MAARTIPGPKKEPIDQPLGYFAPIDRIDYRINERKLARATDLQPGDQPLAERRLTLLSGLAPGGAARREQYEPQKESDR